MSIFKEKIGKQGTWPEAILLLLSPLLVVFAIRWILIEPFVIPSSSMEPTLLVHDHIVVQKFSYGIRFPIGDGWLFNFKTPRRGDVIVFRYPQNQDLFFIKRLIGLPGDKVVVQNGQIIVNEIPWGLIPTESAEQDESTEFSYFLETVPDNDKLKEYKEKSLISEGEEDLSKLTTEEIQKRFESKLKTGDPNKEIGAIESTDHFVRFRADRRHVDPIAQEFVVPKDSYFVMGDNRDQSHDSRFWGFVPHRLVIGKAVRIWLSCSKMLDNAPMVCDPTHLKLERIYKKVQ